MKAGYPLPILLKFAKFEFGTRKKRIKQPVKLSKKQTRGGSEAEICASLDETQTGL